MKRKLTALQRQKLYEKLPLNFRGVKLTQNNLKIMKKLGMIKRRSN